MNNPIENDKKILDERLEREHALLRTLINAIPDGLFLKDTEGRFILANRAIAEAMGTKDPQDLIGRTEHDFYSKEDADSSLQDEQDIIERGNTLVDKLEPKNIGDQKRWILVTKVPVFDPSGQIVGIVGVSRDVTETKNAEEALEHERNLLRTLIDIIPHSIYAKDTAGRKTMANPGDVRVLGYSNEAEVLGKTDFDFFSQEIAETFFADDQSVIQTGKPVIDREEYYFDKWGRERWLLTSKVPLRDAKGDIVGLVGVGRDITEWKEQDAKIQEQAQLLDISTDAITVRDMNNCIRYWNKSAEKTYGFTAQEALGRDEDELLHTKRPEEPREALDTVMELGAWSGDLHYTKKGGGEVLGESRWTIVRDENGNARSILCVSTDVTEQRAIQAQLLRAQRLESLGTLAGGIAHDLNNVLTPILMGLESLGPYISDEKALESLVAITRGAERGANIIRQLLGFARGMEGKRQDVHPRTVLEEIAQIVRQTFPKMIELRLVQLSSDLYTVSGNATQLHQVVMNLCLNARDAMPEGGTLTLSAGNVKADETFVRLHIDAKPTAYVMIEVQDTGQGMVPEIVDKIFDPFFTTREFGKGTGLGLSTTLSIVKGHGGFINVYSEVGKGSCFRVYLPAVQREQTEPTEQPAALPAGQGELVLLVDDEEAVRETTKRALERHGYRVLTAADGAEAVAVYVEHRNEVRGIITDMMLPHMDGTATIRTIRRIDPNVRIIATSGLLSDGYATEARELGIQAFLSKPYTAETLLETLHNVLTSNGEQT